MYRRAKRVLDFVFAVMLLVLTSWLFLLIFIFYWTSNNTPCFFKQKRIGKDDVSFELIKFRTLLNSDLPLSERRFWLGDFLRKTSLDELPQLLNVIRGEMSLIGPRPLPLEYLSFFSQNQRKRHSLLPGITGLAQVNGRHSISWQKKFEYDLYYVNNVSVVLDLKIIVRTIILLLSFQKDRSLDEEKFTGETHE